MWIGFAGYGDTRGPEIDVSASVSVKKVSGLCKSLRFVVLINACSFRLHRWDAIREVLDVNSKLVTNFDHHQQSFVFLFAHIQGLWPQQPLDQIRKSQRDELAEVHHNHDEDVGVDVGLLG